MANGGRSPIDRLLNRDEQRLKRLQELGDALERLGESCVAYREAFRVATGAGWSRKELLSAGLVDPQKLPRVGGKKHVEADNDDSHLKVVGGDE